MNQSGGYHQHWVAMLCYIYGDRFTDLSEHTICESLLSPMSPKQYWPIFSYNASKACNILFIDELRRRLTKHGVLCLAVHPGNVVATGITRHWWLWRLVFTLVRPFAKSKVCWVCLVFHNLSAWLNCSFCKLFSPFVKNLMYIMPLT